MRAWGAEVITHGHDFEESRLEAVRVGAAEGLHTIPPFHEALVRGVARATAELRFEGLGVGFQERMRATYLDIAASAPDRCVVIDASGDEAAVAARVDAAVDLGGTFGTADSSSSFTATAVN